MFERKKWVGDKQINTAESMVDRFDCKGEPIIKVTYIQGGVEYFTKKGLEAMVSDKASDATDVRARHMYPMVQEVLTVLSEYGFKTNDFHYLTQVLQATLDERLEQANDYLWGVNKFNLSLIDLTDVLIKRDNELKHVSK